MLRHRFIIIRLRASLFLLTLDVEILLTLLFLRVQGVVAVVCLGAVGCSRLSMLDLYLWTCQRIFCCFVVRFIVRFALRSSFSEPLPLRPRFDHVALTIAIVFVATMFWFSSTTGAASLAPPNKELKNLAIP